MKLSNVCCRAFLELRAASFLAAVLSLGSSAASAASFNVDDPFAGLGTLSLSQPCQPPESIFQNPYNGSPFVAPMTGSGQFGTGDQWTQEEVSFASTLVDGPPSGGPGGEAYHLSFTVWGASGGWAREQLSYTIWDGTSSAASPQITLSTSSGFDSVFTPAELPPSDNSDDDLSFLFQQAAVVGVPEPSTMALSALGGLILLRRLAR